MSDEEADQVWHQSNQATFPSGTLTDAEIQHQIEILKSIQDQRSRQGSSQTPMAEHTDQLPSSGATAAWRQPIAKGLQSKGFRNSTRNNTSDKTRKTDTSQSQSTNLGFLPPRDVSPSKKDFLPETHTQMSQSASSGQSVFSGLTDTDLAIRASGQKKTAKQRALATNEEDEDDDSTECWPSKTGMRRGNPKQDYNKDGTRKVIHKRKQTNDFGQDTFWNRPTKSKRKHTEGPDAFAATSIDPPTHNLIVDTGASHVLFQHKHMDLLRNVVLSRPGMSPFAVLRAANGQILTAIGKGIFQVKHISVIAYIFKNDDLVHNLLGIAPFADCGCKAVFTAQDFSLYHDKALILRGRRHSENLWHISLRRPPTTNATTANLPPDFHSAKPVLLLHEDTRRDAKYVQFLHACFGSPPPITFLNAVNRGYLSGENQFPRLTAKMVRHNMPNSEATARGHLTKTPTAQPHPMSQSVSARHRAFVQAKRLTPAIKIEKPTNLYTNLKGRPLNDTAGQRPNKGSDAKPPRFDPTVIPRSKTIHLDYTGRLPVRGSAGTLYYLIACWGSYIHIEPLTTMKGPDTATAI
jgi:hypothetical protein